LGGRFAARNRNDRADGAGLVGDGRADERGVTALECSTRAYRLAASCYDLRRDHGLAIRCDREEHPGGWHGRHVLETPVEVVRVEMVEGEAA
jgi:hypothetical protein